MAKDANIDEAVKGTVLSSFYWGYGISQIPGGWAAHRYGGDITLSCSFLLWSLASLFTPSTAVNTHAILVARVCVGVAQGFLIPAIHTVLAQWIPPTERARAVSLTTSGLYLGSAAAMQFLPGVAAAFGPASLPRWVGGLGLSWLAFWHFSLRKIRRGKYGPGSIMPLSDKTRYNTVSSTGSGRSQYRHHQRGGPPPKPTPWRRMASHPAVWAIIVNNYTFHYAFYVVMNWLPTYFDKILHANLASTGAIKTLPYITMFLASNAGGWMGDYIITRGRRSVALGRKVVNTTGFWCAAAALLLMPAATNVSSGVLYTTIALGACGFARGGFSVNHMDIAPKYAGLLMGISNTAGTLSGVVGVAATGRLLEWSGGADKVWGWYQALALAAVQCVGGSIAFVAFGRGDRLFGGDSVSDELD